ncbi:MAG: hypothetical protein CMP96_12550 [Gammaproteobacteria bacterium]|nr:hypothetical protein [Gammaproteobacteria bacterium]
MLSSRLWFEIRLSLQVARVKQGLLIENKGKRPEPIRGKYFLGGPRHQPTSIVLTVIHGLPRIDAI